MFRQTLVILIIFFKHTLSLSTYLKWLYKSLSGPGMDKLLHLVITLVNSSSENSAQEEGRTELISLRTSFSM